MVNPYLIFAKDMAHPERVTTSGRTGTNTMEWKV
jgi:hypothetical protein